MYYNDLHEIYEDFEIEFYGYHHGETSPINYETDHIFGLELEATELDIDDLETGIQYGHFNLYSDPEPEAGITIEEDASVLCEFIFRADTQANLLQRLKSAYPYLTSDNTSGTSAHIHINRNYLYDKGITSTAIIQAGIIMAKYLFKISERDYSTANEWAEFPNIDYIKGYGAPYNIDWRQIRGMDLFDLIKLSKEFNIYHDRKYYFINTRPEDTIEVRIFSNYCNFNPDTIADYFTAVNILIELASKIQRKATPEEIIEYLTIMEVI